MSTTPSKHIVIDNRIRQASTGRYSDRLVEHLQTLDTTNRYTILLSEGDNWHPSTKNFTARTVSYKQFSLNPLDQIQFAKTLYSLHADLVHFPMNQQPLLYFKPVVTSTLDLTMLRYTRAGKTPLPIHYLKMLGYRFLFWYSNKKSRQIITISNYVKKELNAIYPFTKGKTTTTYCASEPPIKKAHKPSKHPERFLLYVGTAFPHKNLENLVRAFEIIAQEDPTLRLVLVGKKEFHYEQLEKVAATSPVAKRIIITGFVTDEELAWYYRHALAYVFPSLSEGFGLPGLEAMTYECPVISSNATCLPEIYEKAAAYFDPEDVHDIAQQITNVLTSPESQKMLVEAGKNQLKKYSWQVMAQQTLAVYKKALRINT